MNLEITKIKECSDGHAAFVWFNAIKGAATVTRALQLTGVDAGSICGNEAITEQGVISAIHNALGIDGLSALEQELDTKAALQLAETRSLPWMEGRITQY